MRRRIVAGLVLLAMLSVTALAQQQSNLWVGTWKPNRAKSTYSGTPPTGDQTIRLELVNGLLQVATTTTNAQGQATTNTYLVKFGGEQPVNPTTGVTRTYRWIDDRTYEGATKVKGQSTTTTIYALARDGKTHTVTTKGKNAQGVIVNNVVLYEKE
jgi:hypothetical protein